MHVYMYVLMSAMHECIHQPQSACACIEFECKAVLTGPHRELATCVATPAREGKTTSTSITKDCMLSTDLQVELRIKGVGCACVYRGGSRISQGRGLNNQCTCKLGF